MLTNFKRAAVAALLSVAIAPPVFAQAATGGILTIDIERLYSDSAAAKSAQAQMVTRYQGPQSQANTAFETARNAYQTQVAAAQKLVGPSGDASKLPPATQQALGQAEDRVSEARNQALGLQQAIQDSAAYVREQIIQAVVPLAEQVRAERKAALVVPRGTVLAADPAGDVTAVILPRLDAKITSVQIVRPQPTAPAAAPGAAPAAPRPQPQGR
ncbi:OmpH family outer membrane protein [Sphingomonas sp. BIUV-7]|uniref:OmpH family outer membrane protein n=1 Tax=Sphingomonas natans TaxID=3063330 RepID=A0ABT8Y3U4_9SPHN|nr:OmpH family outer membrane protein [Sphingomonas sp. BIUV-7]MDO6412982.1 OmpH family outer membrane protein [Sphingomonas sp. BIUV-7]